MNGKKITVEWENAQNTKETLTRKNKTRDNRNKKIGQKFLCLVCVVILSGTLENIQQTRDQKKEPREREF